jgi:AAA15 family ATPase/GTPase
MKGFRQSFNIDPSKGMADSKFEEAEILMPRFTHKTSEISAEFEFVDESQGTQKLFSLAGLLFEIIEKGSILVIDELDRSFHPLLVRKIIETFQNPSINRLGAQLIFTTHDIAQLDSTLLRRDQVWFTEKRRDQSSQLVPLTEFSPRKGEALERGYLEGRYGGVPILANRLIIDSASAER